MGTRLALAAVLTLLLCAAPAAAHEAPLHADTRAEVADLDVKETLAALDPATGLPTTWCGVRTTADTPGTGVSTPQFKVVYAYAADGTDRSAAWSDTLQADISTLSRFVAAQSGGRKSPRFDMGTTCGAEYVDVQVVQLPGTRDAYVNNFSAVRTDVRDRLNASPGGPRDVVVLADGLSPDPVGWWSGLATLPYDERAGVGNVTNSGGLFAVMWVPQGEPAPASGWWPEGILHEMTHNMGGVQVNAPYSSTVGHCYENWDVMCYADGGPFALVDHCPKLTGAMTKTYDCNGDTYFNPNPPAGSWLATHWNVYTSAFLAPCAEIAPACGESGGTTLTPPVATAAPAVYGSAMVGETQYSTPGSWMNSPTSYAYRWQRGSSASWTDISGATAASYVLQAADAGQQLRLVVSATNADGTTVAASEPSAVVTAPVVVTPTPTPTAAPSTTPTSTVVPVRTATPVVVPTVLPQPKRGTLRIAAGKARGKRLGTLTFTPSGDRLRVGSLRLRLAKGRYQVRLCTPFGCAKRTLNVRRTGKVRLPALSVAGTATGAKYTLTGRSRRFVARAAV